MPPAARVTDMHTCPMFDGPKPHVGGPVLPPCSTNVLTASLPQARATDKATCVGAPDTILMGSMTVRVNGLMAARQMDQTVHGGLIVLGALNVEIGGPVGTTTGFPLQWQRIGAGMSAGRTSGDPQQSYQNCGVESSRQLIAASGGNVSEDALLSEAIAHHDAGDDPDPAERGGTSPAGRENILARRGVASHQEPQTMANIERAVGEGRGVVTSHDAGQLWNDPAYAGGGHAIVVTGVERDAAGNRTAVLVNDTGQGQYMQSVPAAQFEGSLRPGRNANVTDNPVVN